MFPIQNTVFYDTSAWIALYHSGDKHHTQILEWHQKIGKAHGTIITSNFVIAETHAYFCTSPKKALQIASTILSSAVVRVYRVSPEDEARAWQIIKKYQDKDFSFCDTTSFALIERLKIPKTISFDKHFTQYGIPLFNGK